MVHNILYYFHPYNTLTNSIIISLIATVFILVKYPRIYSNLSKFIEQFGNFILSTILLSSIITSTIFIRYISSQKFIGYSSDAISHIKVIEDILNSPQSFFYHSHFNQGKIGKGLFYPLAAHYLPATLNVVIPVSLEKLYFISNVIIIFYLYPIFLMIFLKLVSNRNISFYIVFLSYLAPIFPLEYSLTSNFAQLYSNICLFGILALLTFLNGKIVKDYYIFYVILFSVVLFTVHPSSIFTMLIFLLFTNGSFSNYFRIIRDHKKIIVVALIGTILLFIQLRIFTLGKSYINALPQINENFDMTFESLIFRLTNNISKYLIYMNSEFIKFPFFAFIILLIGLLFKKYKRINFQIKSGIKLYIFSYVILFSSILASFPSLISKISILSFPYYTSPARITHFIILSSFYLIAIISKDLFDKKLYDFSKSRYFYHINIFYFFITLIFFGINLANNHFII